MIGRLLYAFVFVVLLPAGLAWWAKALDRLLPLPALTATGVGAGVAGAGLALMLAGMWALIRHGRGLPMNAFPPPVYVQRGAYRITSHPIYLGFALLVLGAAWATRSPAGIWLVAPVVTLAMVALVLGYERLDLRRRFGESRIHRPFLSLPPDEPLLPSLGERLGVLLLVGIPWTLAFEGVCVLGPAPDAVVVTFPFERAWPVLLWTEPVYAFAYPFVVLTPFVVRSRRHLRDMAIAGLLATALVIPLYLVVPFVAPPRPFEAGSLLGRALLAERAMCHTVASFPSFHVIWALLAARAWSTRSRSWGIAGWSLACLISISCLTTGMHGIVDVVAGVVVYAGVVRWRSAWTVLRLAAERLANSWREWRWGRVRLLSYAFPAAAAATSGFLLAATLGGRAVVWPLLGVFTCGLVGAGLWAQRLEGSSRLSRPFGYFGGALGVVAGVVLTGIPGGNLLVLGALMSIVAPWTQAIGRMRCLVQGCCFGSPAPDGFGIRYFEPRSRVCAHAQLTGVPLYPTPVYSMLANVVIGVLLWRRGTVGAPLTLIIGGYFILSGLARFVEEAYRGEPQTPIVAGLRLYQWLATAWVLAGVVVTALPSSRAGGQVVSIAPEAWFAALSIGVVVGAAMGIDFPGSSRRFARLAPP